jgi:NitT/TauT family transport system permease protein
MSLLRTFPTRGVLARPGRSVADVIVFLGAAALLWLIVRLTHGVTVPWNQVTALSTVSTAPAELPYYAARSLLRMFATLALSIVVIFAYATAAARLRRTEKVLLPLLDILQSVPILGFLRRGREVQQRTGADVRAVPAGRQNDPRLHHHKRQRATSRAVTGRRRHDPD